MQIKLYHKYVIIYNILLGTINNVKLYMAIIRYLMPLIL